MWGIIPLIAAATTILGLKSAENGLPLVLIGMGLGISWLVITFFAARSGCPKCKKWFSGDEVTRLPADGMTVYRGFGSYGPRPRFDVTYRCAFCGNLWITRA